MGWNIVMLRQACHFALEKNQAKKPQGNSKLKLKLPKNSRKLRMGKLNLPEFFSE